MVDCHGYVHERHPHSANHSQVSGATDRLGVGLRLQNRGLRARQPAAPDERGSCRLSVIFFVKLIALCEWFSTKHKRTGTSNIYCQAAVSLDEGLSERSVGCIDIYVAMVVFMVTIRASMLLEAV